MTRVTLGKSRVRESCTPGSVRAKAEWLSYSTVILYPRSPSPGYAGLRCQCVAVVVATPPPPQEAADDAEASETAAQER